MELIQLNPSIPRQRRRIEQFLGDNGLRLDDVDYYAALVDDTTDEIVAGGGLKGGVIKCVAVADGHKGEAVANQIVSHLIAHANADGHQCVKLFTKPQNQKMFESMSFRLLAEAPKAILMETGIGGIKRYSEELESEKGKVKSEESECGSEKGKVENEEGRGKNEESNCCDAVDAVLLVSWRKTKRYLLFNDDMKLVGWTNIETGEVRSPYPELNPKECRMYAFAGIHALSPRLLKMMDEFPDRFGIIDFYLKACATHNIKGYVKDDLKLMDIGKLDTLAQAEEFLKELEVTN